jgi:hypothetical protein
MKGAGQRLASWRSVPKWAALGRQSAPGGRLKGRRIPQASRPRGCGLVLKVTCGDSDKNLPDHVQAWPWRFGVDVDRRCQFDRQEVADPHVHHASVVIDVDRDVQSASCAGLTRSRR